MGERSEMGTKTRKEILPPLFQTGSPTAPTRIIDNDRFASPSPP
jgi:hypothetical protein